PARALPAQPAAGADAVADLRARLGLRLRRDVERAVGLRGLPAAQARGGRRVAPAPDRSRRRLRAPGRAVNRLSFRARIALLAALAIAVTVAGASFAVWVVAKHELFSQLDSTLITQATSGGHGPFGGNNLTLVIHADGDRTGQLQIPVTSRALKVASGAAGSYFTNTKIERIPVRGLVLPTPRRPAIVTVAALQPTTRALHRIRFWILLVGAIGIAL